MLNFTRRGEKGFVVLSYREMEEIVLMISDIKIDSMSIKVLSDCLYRSTSKDFKAREYAIERIRECLEDIEEIIKKFKKKYARALYRLRN